MTASQQLGQSMQQGMVLTGSMQLYLRTLQATLTELSHITTRALNSNPTLEEVSVLPTGATPTVPDFEATRRHDAVMDNLPQPVTLNSYLEEQVRRSALHPTLERACLEIISHIDSHGFLDGHAAARLTSPVALRKKALQTVQDLEPAGVGARDLRESLMLQLQREGEDNGLPYKLLRDCWDELVRHKYAEAARSLSVTGAAVAAAARRISRLNPDPGSSFAPTETNVITPDVSVTRNGEKLEVTLTGECIPRLVLSEHYREMLANGESTPEVRHYLSRSFREGRELIRAIEMRQATILNTAEAIAERQRSFFLKGPAHLAPLRMEDIAAAVGIHTSTVSRAVNGKYLRCDFGVFELRSFFSAAIAAENKARDGKEADGTSAAAIRTRLKEFIAAENPCKPLSDAKLEAQLAAEGIHVARRTIAKYREQLRILPAFLRKKA